MIFIYVADETRILRYGKIAVDGNAVDAVFVFVEGRQESTVCLSRCLVDVAV